MFVACIRLNCDVKVRNPCALDSSRNILPQLNVNYVYVCVRGAKIQYSLLFAI